MFNLPEFYESKVIQLWAHIFESKLSYGMIIGQDLMSELGIKLILNFYVLDGQMLKSQ